MSLYPLLFEPRYVPKIWGGRRLAEKLSRRLPSDDPIGESWELYDFPPGVADRSGAWLSARVANGPLAGQSLHDLVQSRGAELLGDVKPVAGTGQFPLLIKFLDAREDLSVQVHPTPDYVARHPGAHLKSEAWYVIDAVPGSRLLIGLKPGVTPGDMAQALRDGTADELLNAIPARPGQCYYLPSGTVHALGAGILVAEVQTPSDTTFRLFDFNRIDPSTQKPRELHVDEALQCIDYASAGSTTSPPRSHVAGLFTTVTRLTSCEFFTIEKVRFVEGVEESLPYDHPVIWMMLDGHVQLSCAEVEDAVDVKAGQTVLLPGDVRDARIRTVTQATWLEVTFQS